MWEAAINPINRKPDAKIGHVRITRNSLLLYLTLISGIKWGCNKKKHLNMVPKYSRVFLPPLNTHFMDVY